jgi:recombinational DNA repair protein (RecF pathway)
MEQIQICADCGGPIEKVMLAVPRPGRRCRRCAKAAFDLHLRHAIEVLNQTRPPVARTG